MYIYIYIYDGLRPERVRGPAPGLAVGRAELPAVRPLCMYLYISIYIYI